MTSPVPPPKETYQNGLRTLAEVHSGFNVKKRAHPWHEFVGGTFSLAWIFSPHPYPHPYNGPSEKQRNLSANRANRLQPEMKLGKDFAFSVSVLKLKLSSFLCSRQRPQRSKSSDMTHGKRFLKWIAVTEQVIRYGSLWSEQNLSMVTPSSPSCASISLVNWFVHQEIYTTIYSIQLWEPRVKHMLI